MTGLGMNSSVCLLTFILIYLGIAANGQLTSGVHTYSVQRFVNERFRFNCSSDLVRRDNIRWYHNNVQVIKKQTRIIKKNGNLVLTRLNPLDTGVYECFHLKKNATLTRVNLTVEAAASIHEPLKDLRVNWNMEVKLECKVVGIPPPVVYWKKNGQPIRDPQTDKSYMKPTLVINATETANYSCSPENIHNTKDNINTTTCKVTVINIPRPGYCAHYNGSICKDHIQGSLVFFKPSVTPSSQEAVVRGLVAKMESSFSSYCLPQAKNLLCHYAFPDCGSADGVQEPKPLCRENCKAVKELYCYKDWLNLRRYETKPQHLHKDFTLPDCDTLPRYTEDNNSCSEADLLHIDEHDKTTECYSHRGEYYAGTINVTASGLPCQPWSSQHPHQHTRHPNVFPILTDSHNYCRNAGGEEKQPWCYTMSREVRFEYCDVPKCLPKPGQMLAAPTDDWTEDLILVVLSTFVMCLLVGISILGFLMCKQRSKHQHEKNYVPTPQYEIDINVDNLHENSIYHQRSLSAQDEQTKSELSHLEFPRNDIVFICDLGHWAFGRVFKAKAPNLVKSEEWTMVAGKMLREDASPELATDFEREAALMVEFDHQNIVKLLGVCAIGKPMCLLFEYMDKGDLNDFLRNCRSEHFITRQNSNESLIDMCKPKLDHCEQLHIAKQIAAGMVYLTKKGYVHRDLATRNCLVGDKLTVKLADFGLTRTINYSDGDYYRGGEHDAIPIRWTAIEAILFNKFSEESDVWSYGVVLWEIFTFALEPYDGKSHEEVLRYIMDGNTLSCPENTPKEIYDLMIRCWCKKPQERPPFKELFEAVDCMLTDMRSKSMRKRTKSLTRRESP